eukprot:2944560-Karenia_brevis.AAC.1
MEEVLQPETGALLQSLSIGRSIAAVRQHGNTNSDVLKRDVDNDISKGAKVKSGSEEDVEKHCSGAAET